MNALQPQSAVSKRPTPSNIDITFKCVTFRMCCCIEEEEHMPFYFSVRCIVSVLHASYTHKDFSVVHS